MNQETKSAVFGLNWLQEAKAKQEAMSGSYDADREVWITAHGQAAAGSFSPDLRTAYYTSSYSSSYSGVSSGGGYIDCDTNCDANCDIAAS